MCVCTREGSCSRSDSVINKSVNGVSGLMSAVTPARIGEREKKGGKRVSLFALDRTLFVPWPYTHSGARLRALRN